MPLYCNTYLGETFCCAEKNPLDSERVSLKRIHMNKTHFPNILVM